jgi:hypothetical protein
MRKQIISYTSALSRTLTNGSRNAKIQQLNQRIDSGLCDLHSSVSATASSTMFDRVAALPAPSSPKDAADLPHEKRIAICSTISR